MIWLSYVYKSSATHKCIQRLWGARFCEDPTITKLRMRQYYRRERGQEVHSVFSNICVNLGTFKLLNNGTDVPLIFIGVTKATQN